jgi:hypothetical protein
MNVVAPGITQEEYQSGKALPIDVFERQIKGWILAFAEHLAVLEDSAVAVLTLTSAILEPLGGALLGKGQNPKAKFCRGFERVFPTVPGSESARHTAEGVYDYLRNGLFHEAFIKAGLRLIHQDMPIQEKDGEICLDPERFFKAVDSTFAQVCGEIRSLGASQETFNKYWTDKQNVQATKLRMGTGAQYSPISPVLESLSTSAPMTIKLPLPER